MENIPHVNRKVAGKAKLAHSKKYIGLAQSAVQLVLDDFTVDDLHEVLTRNGWYLPVKCHW